MDVLQSTRAYTPKALPIFRLQRGSTNVALEEPMNRIRKKGIEKISALLDIELNYSHAKHNFELGLPLEASLRQFFRPYFPSRYGFTSGYIVDDSDTESNQTDWIIFDSEYFSPLLAKIHGT